MPTAPVRIRGRGSDGQAIVDLGPLETVKDCEDALTICARAVAAGKDPRGDLLRASIIIGRKLWSRFQTKGLEIKGLNMDGTAPEVKVTLNDYAQAHDLLVEENAQLRAQNEALMQARERPRPPRPQMN